MKPEETAKVVRDTYNRSMQAIRVSGSSAAGRRKYRRKS